jgi:hypothetical protein
VFVAAGGGRVTTSNKITGVTPQSKDWTAFSSLPDKQEGLAAAAAVTGSVFEGLDVRREIGAVLDQGLGDTVLVYEGDDLAAFGVCHVGREPRRAAGGAS